MYAPLLCREQGLHQRAMGQIEHGHINLIAGLAVVEGSEQGITNGAFGEQLQACVGGRVSRLCWQGG